MTFANRLGAQHLVIARQSPQLVDPLVAFLASMQRMVHRHLNAVAVLAVVAPLFVRAATAQDAARLSAQPAAQLSAAYPDSLCGICAEWNVPHEPFRVHGSTYYVGTRGLGAVLIASDHGHILIDGGLPNSAPLILQNIRTLGFEPGDVRLILNSHVHYDHAGGLAALQAATGARVAASTKSATALEAGHGGPNDPQYGVLLDYPPVDGVDRFTPGDTLRVGELMVTSHATAGHTPGGTSWSWLSCDAAGCREIVYADSQTPVSADGFRYTNAKTYPDAIDDFLRGFELLESLKCDILLTTHPGASQMWERMDDGVAGLESAEACVALAAAGRRALQRRIDSERESSGKSN